MTEKYEDSLEVLTLKAEIKKWEIKAELKKLQLEAEMKKFELKLAKKELKLQEQLLCEEYGIEGPTRSAGYQDEIMAAIAMALQSEGYSVNHDRESFKLTMKPRKTSAWTSKQLTMRELPR